MIYENTILSLLLLLIFYIVGCSSSSDRGGVNINSLAQELHLSIYNTSIDISSGNNQAQANVEFIPIGTKCISELTYSSSNTNVTTVDNNGLIIGLSAGSTIITASCDNLSST